MTAMAFKFHSCIFPVILIIMGVYCLVTRNSISCISDSISSSIFDTYCLQNMYTIPAPKEYDVYSSVGPQPHPGVSPMEEENPKVSSHSYFGLMLLVWAWVFYSSGEVWKYEEGGFVKSLQDSKEPQKIILKSPGKCCLYLMKYLSVLAVAILQLILFRMVISMALFGKTDEKGNVEDLQNEGQENSKSSWIAIANGEQVLQPTMAKCTYHKYGSSGTIQTHDALCHVDFNSHLEMIYLCCMVFSIISLVHIILAFLHTIIISCVNPLQVLHLCLCGSYTWTEARECLARREMFSGKWMLLQKFLPIQTEDNLEMDMGEMLGKSGRSQYPKLYPGVEVQPSEQ